MFKRLLLLSFLSLFSTLARAELQSVLQMVDYLGVDYAGAVSAGQVLVPSEYAEMQEFGQHIETGIAALAPNPAQQRLTAQAAALREAIANKADAAEIQKRTQELRLALMTAYPIALTPRKAPDLAQAAALYSESCSSCHGMTGHGDGPAAASLEPKPIAFTDHGRARQRSLFGLYNTISLGVQGTSMPAFAQLSDDERWALAFYVGAFASRSDAANAGAKLWKTQALSLEDAVTRSPAELSASLPGLEAEAFWLRQHPEHLFKSETDALGYAINTLDASIESARKGNWSAAADKAVSAYLEGFELSEAALRNLSPDLMSRGERAMMAYRKVLADHPTLADAETAYSNARALLAESQQLLSETTLSPAVGFTSALVILLREGLEAILVLAAMFAFLTKTDRREAMRYVHYGWVGALALGGLTWAISAYFIQISGAAREMTEAVTALLAAVILFYVGYWMHQSANAQRWNAFLKDQIQSALSQKTLWSLTAIAFMAVYREVFETILFYQTLWLQVGDDAKSSVFGGIALAAVLLVIVTWLIVRAGTRLPLKQFFSVSALLMIALAIVFAGKGVVALQEAGKLAPWPIHGPRVDLLGIYPDAASLLAQGLLLLLALYLLLRQRRSVEA